MKLRIARKICKYMGHGYPIDNTQRLDKAVRVWGKATKRFKHFERDITMRCHPHPYKLKKWDPNTVKRILSCLKETER